jgi:hypothetical protein
MQDKRYKIQKTGDIFMTCTGYKIQDTKIQVTQDKFNMQEAYTRGYIG